MKPTPKRRQKIIERDPVALLYVRVSTGAQVRSGLSMEQQEATLRGQAAQLGFDQVQVIREEGKSGHTIKARPELTAALELLAEGRASALITTNLDRLARNASETLKIADLANAQGWRLLSLDLGLDTASPVGRLVLTMLAAVAEMERERIRERHRQWHAADRERGNIWGVDKGMRSALAPAIRSHILNASKQGQSLRAIADGLNAKNTTTAAGSKWYPVSISRVLDSPASRVVA